MPIRVLTRHLMASNPPLSAKVCFVLYLPLAIIFSNGQFYGAGMHGAPKASLNDGLLHYGILGNVKLFDMIQIVPLLYKGEHDTHPKVTVGSCQQFTCQLLPDQKSTHKLRIEADGEICGVAPCTVSVVPKALPLVVAQFE